MTRRAQEEPTRAEAPEAYGQVAAKYPFKYWEAPHLHRRDGSYTNW